MGELTEEMLASVRAAYLARDLSELSLKYDQVVVLREAVLAYLQHVGRGELSDAESDEHARLVAAAGDIENLAGAISRELAPLEKTLKEADITPSEETAALLRRLLQTIQEGAHSALQALIEGDGRGARTGVPLISSDVHLLVLRARGLSSGSCPRSGSVSCLHPHRWCS